MARPPVLVRVFATRGFWRVWAGSMYWYSARWMDLFVLQWQVLLLTDSAFQVTLIGFYRLAPMFAIGLFTGVLADRVDRRKVILFAQLWNAGAAALIALLLLTDRLALWHLAVLVTAFGFSWALDMPSRRSYIYDLMGPRRAVNAMALEHLGMDGAKVAGPVLGGLLWPLIGAGGCLLLLSVGYVVNFGLYLGLSPAPPADRGPRQPVLSNLRDGIRYVLTDPVILGILGVTVAMNLLAFPYQQVVPVVARKVLGLGPRLTGVLLAADGLGAMTGSLVLASRRRIPYKGRVFALGSACLMLAIFCLSFSRWYLVSFALLFVAGCGTACFAACQSSVIMLSASDAMRGRAMGTLMLAIGFGPLGALVIGALATWLGAPLAMRAMTGAGLVVLATLLWRATELRAFRG